MRFPSGLRARKDALWPMGNCRTGFPVEVSQIHTPSGAVERANCCESALNAIGPVPFSAGNSAICCQLASNKNIDESPLRQTAMREPSGEYAGRQGWLVRGWFPIGISRTWLVLRFQTRIG